MTIRTSVVLVMTLACAQMSGGASGGAVPADETRIAAAPLVPDYWPTNGWRDTTPESEGISSAVLAEAIDTALAEGHTIHSLLLIRHGRVVLDASFYPYKSGTRHDIASVTKSITSVLAGIAQQRSGLDVTRRIDRILGAQDADVRRSTLNVENLLAMRSGLACAPEGGEPQLRAMMASSNWVEFALQLPMKTLPDRESSYCSPNYHLVSAAITAATHGSELDFARDNLFAPLGITDVVWPADPQGITHGWGDLQLEPRDLAKIGFLYLHNGVWGGTRIVASDWITRSTTPRSAFDSSNLYGLGWWMHPSAPRSYYEALGRGGQRLGILPAQDAILVITAGGFEPGVLGSALFRAFVTDSAIAEDRGALARLRARITAVAKAPAPTSFMLAPTAQRVSGVTYALSSNEFGFRTIRFDFAPRSPEAHARLVLGERVLDLVVGLDGVYRSSPTEIDGVAPMARGRWTSDDEFVLDLNLVGKIDDYTITSRFDDDALSLRIEESSRHSREEVSAHASR